MFTHKFDVKFVLGDTTERTASGRLSPDGGSDEVPRLPSAGVTVLGRSAKGFAYSVGELPVLPPSLDKAFRTKLRMANCNRL